MRKDCSVGQRSGGTIEDGDGAAPPGGSAPSGESRDSSTEQPRKGGTQQGASPRGEAPRAGECPGPQDQQREIYFLISRASLLHRARRVSSCVCWIYTTDALWLDGSNFHLPMCPLPRAAVSLSVSLPTRLATHSLSLSVLSHHMYPGRDRLES